ncbi:MAG: tRNA (adenosine(37)-N6)-threonylcarbamoyltransferase complex ATPase subunit type 1 TsaE [Spirochaetaceae bacterium]|nr:MAG: tRNA (adenosine(37)-N6)-threonylcarbamoyltransferase complex ATPase subunit type 1 TsaE [Spirochaetaceae bacterium]
MCLNQSRPTRLISDSAARTRAIAAELAERLQPGDVVALRGPMGAGKTVFVKGIADAFGVREPVTSATFTIITEYEGRIPLVHADLYRLHGSAEAAETGLQDYLRDSSVVVVIEWAERASDLYPSDTIWISISVSEDGRRAIAIDRTEQQP